MTPTRDVAGVMKLNGLTLEELAHYAARHQIEFEGDETACLQRVEALLGVLARLEEIEQPPFTLRHPDRDPGRTPEMGEDPYNAIIRFCLVRGAEIGPLAGMRIGVKDNIAVAGVPMTRGSRTAPPRLPSQDAVVIERLLDAGATIVAKTSISDTVALGAPQPLNPLNPRFSPGGSSSGSAVAVAGGLVDAALGADEGGSIRIPAAWCGIVGMKATHGLVPTYGMSYWDHTLDHIGPMTHTVGENAKMLEVLAGGDWRDPQWGRADPATANYTEAADHGVAGLSIGVITESLKPSGCTTATLEALDDVQRILDRLGAQVVPVSVPLWTDTFAILLAELTCGLTAMRESFGQAYGHLGAADTDLVATAAAHYWNGQDTLPFEGKALPLAYERVRETGLGTHFARARNLRLELRRQIDSALARVDLLITPTTPHGPPELTNTPTVPVNQPEEDYSLGRNTWPLNLTGHPALTIPCGRDDKDMPTGLQIIGRRFDEHTVYRVGFAFEAALRAAT